MKKLLLILTLTCAGVLLTNTGFAKQTVQVYVQLPSESPSAALLLVIYDIDKGKKSPYFMPLTPGQTLQTFQVEGNHFQIIEWTIQAPNLTFTPCAPTSIIDNHSLIVNIMGKIAANGLHCASREVAVIPQLTTAPTPVASAPISSETAVIDPKAGKKTIAEYLTALSKQCQKGQFNAAFDSQTVTYKILGMKDGKCDVTIGTNKLPPMQCHFTQNDIALLASPAAIESYSNGTAEYSENSLDARIMKARCKTAAGK